jgi:hypothetical protein
MNAEAEQDKVHGAPDIPVPVLRDGREQKACAPGVKLSRLQRWILHAALQGVGTEKERAELQQAISSILDCLGGSPGRSLRVDRSKVGHLDRKQILAGYFGLKRSCAAFREANGADWWRRWPCKEINHPDYRLKVVEDLTPAELERAINYWCPNVLKIWNSASKATRQTYQALVQARTFQRQSEALRRTLYNRANASICRALRRLRARGLLVPARYNNAIRLTPKGVKAARKLSQAVGEAHVTTSSERNGY